MHLKFRWYSACFSMLGVIGSSIHCESERCELQETPNMNYLDCCWIEFDWFIHACLHHIVVPIRLHWWPCVGSMLPHAKPHRHQPYCPSGKLIIELHAVTFATILTMSNWCYHARIHFPILVEPGDYQFYSNRFKVPPGPEPPLLGISCLLVALIVSGVSKLVANSADV